MRNLEHTQRTAPISVHRLCVLILGCLLLLGLSVLVGWQFDIELFMRPIKGTVAMNPATAVCFLLCGLSLVFQQYGRKWLANGMALAVAILMLLKLAALLLGTETFVDTLLFTAKLEGEVGDVVRNRMAPNTALGFLLAAVALLAHRTVGSRYAFLSEWAEYAATALFLLSVVSMLGYVYRIREFYGVLNFIPMAPHTAVGFLLLSQAIFCAHPESRFMKVLLSPLQGSYAMRIMLPMALLGPIALGLMRITGQRMGLFSQELGVTMAILLEISVLVLLIWQVARTTNQSQRLSMATTQKLAALNGKLEEKVQERTQILEKQTTVLERKLKELSDYKYSLDQGTIVAITDQKGIIRHVNDNFCAISGYSRDELLGQDHRIVNSGYHSKEFMRNLWRTIANGEVWKGIIRNRKKDGSYYWVDTTIVPFLDEQGKPIRYMAIRSDLTDLKDTTERLSASEARFRYTLDNMMEGVQIIGSDLRYQYVNDAVVEHGKHAKEDLVGHTMMECYPGIEHTEVFKTIEKCLGEEEGANHHMENHFEYPDGTSAWFELSIQRVPEGVFILSIDITERKRAEEKLNRLNATLERKVEQRTAQLEATNKELEAFSYSVSHDLRAPLRAINGFSEMVESQYAEKLDDNGKRLLGIIKSNAITMGKLIDDLLEFSRTGRKEVQNTKVDMQAIVKGCLKDLEQEYGNTHQVTVKPLPTINCDPQLMTHVWGNLLSNAFKYSAKKENPQVTVWADEQDGEVTFHVQDNGAGFNMEYANKLFGVFQRLHSTSEFEGTGVGLAIVNRIVVKHGGRIWAAAEPEKGATFHFSLPRTTLKGTPKTKEHEQENS